jgi:branched-chain amino acid aminotransferase
MARNDTTTFPVSFTLTPSTSARVEAHRDEILADPGFGNYFTDHMIEIDWTVDEGWHNAQVKPYGPLSIEPGSAVLHYGQEIF